MKKLALFVGVILWLPYVVLAQTAPSPDELTNYKGLHAAAAKGDVGKINSLAKSGADLNARDGFGRTALMVATYQNHRDAAKVLIRAGADVNALDSERYDMITIAAVANNLPMMKLAIASGGNPKLMTSPYDGTALIAAAHLGHVEVVRELIRTGAPLNHINNLKWTALIEAIVLGDGGKNHQLIVQALIEAGADVNLTDGNGTTPLTLARTRNFTAMVKMLEAAGAKP
tara:strand:+ start:2228 stop:2914 length:687 start_codon:yes stop_codon:yes gene_type:complete